MQFLYLAATSVWPDVIDELKQSAQMLLIGGGVVLGIGVLILGWRWTSIGERVAGRLKNLKMKLPKGDDGQHVEVEFHLSPPVAMEGSEEEVVDGDPEGQQTDAQRTKRRRQKRPPSAS